MLRNAGDGPTVQAVGGGVIVWGIISGHKLGPLTPIEQRLHALKNPMSNSGCSA
jgi:hypothetical protein